LPGRFPVLPTPFRDDGAIDESDFCRSSISRSRSGVDGVVYPGVASEVDTLTPEERRRQVALLGERVAGRIPIVIGASDPDPKASARSTSRRPPKSAPPPPWSWRPSISATTPPRRRPISKQVSDGASVPIMLQNQPKPIGAGLTPEEVADVANAVPAIRYVKEETPPCGQHLTRIKAATNGSVEAIFGGAGGRYITDELARGAAGTMPAAELADIHAALIHAWQSGEVRTARKLYAALPAAAEFPGDLSHAHDKGSAAPARGHQERLRARQGTEVR
jgi:4-hydroxy-tetrahydrodipicolinate synthase